MWNGRQRSIRAGKIRKIARKGQILDDKTSDEVWRSESRCLSRKARAQDDDHWFEREGV